MSSGVDRVVEQVVNPKTYKVFKPQIDKVICEYLGIDQKQRLEKLRTREKWERRQRQLQCQQEQEATNNQNAHLAPPGTVPSCQVKASYMYVILY